jgi:hypothetical protein
MFAFECIRNRLTASRRAAPLTPSATAAVFAAIFVLATVGGCQHSDTVEITGKVTLDGAPLADGTIHFDPIDKSGPRAGTIIRDGAYKLRLRPGNKTVRIDGFRIVGERPFNPGDPNSAMIPTKESIVPDKYNGQSTLSCDVGPAGGEQNFELVGAK